MADFFTRENFPMTTSIADSLSKYGNRFQNAFLNSGVNTGKTGFNSGLVSYTPNTKPVTGLDVKAPPRASVASTKPNIAATKTSTPTVKSLAGSKRTSGSAATKPTVTKNPTTTVQASAAPVGSVEDTYDYGGNALGLGLNGDNYTFLNPQTGLAETVALNADQMAAINNPYVSDGTSLAFGNAGDNWWTQNKDMIGGIAQGIQAGTGLANAYLGYKNYGLAKDQFNFAKAAANRDVANQAQLINNEIQNAGEVGMSLAGNTMSPEQRAVRQQQLNAMRVSGAPIG